MSETRGGTLRRVDYWEVRRGEYVCTRADEGLGFIAAVRQLGLFSVCRGTRACKTLVHVIIENKINIDTTLIVW